MPREDEISYPVHGIMPGSAQSELLELVSQEETEDTTSMTQWSVIYDLTEYSAIFNVRREYDNQFIFNGFVKNRLNL